MREIKFRVWDQVDEKMIHGWNLDLCLYLSDQGVLTAGGYKVIMQCIGLKDESGREIYEGDIVKCRDTYEPITFTGKVSFDNGSFFVETDLGGHYRWLDYEVEVIGNVFENIDKLEVPE